jgi:hypothetical protein
MDNQSITHTHAGIAHITLFLFQSLEEK